MLAWHRRRSVDTAERAVKRTFEGAKFMGAAIAMCASTFVRLRPDALALTEIACTPGFPSPWSDKSGNANG
jgi:hypothetical protein